VPGELRVLHWLVGPLGGETFHRCHKRCCQESGPDASPGGKCQHVRNINWKYLSNNLLIGNIFQHNFINDIPWPELRSFELLFLNYSRHVKGLSFSLLNLTCQHLTSKFNPLTFVYPLQSGLNISESVILTNSNNDTDLVGTNFFQCYFNPL